jgi:7,8-dihydropterin-6-yl-methyl-4-(beta-D-ribofuranosyl)aminobenzene 5'-phosphate synthase
MIIKTLAENTSISKKFGSEHGLSLYIEVNDCKILFDTGASELFFENAKKMEVDISNIDYLIISHGHYDHGGGLEAFFRKNAKAQVFLHPLAFGKYYALRSSDKFEYIGLKEELKENSQIVFTSDNFIIRDGIWVFSNIIKAEPPPASNNRLYMEEKGKMIQDTFLHEQNLIIEEDEKNFLVVGCAHNGITNILQHFYNLKGCMPDYVIGGFHLSSRSGEDKESLDTIGRIGKFFMDTNGKYYTCHCTGIEPYKRLKAVMGDRIGYLSAGSEIKI